MVAEDNAYLKFKVDKLRQQNKELKEKCQDLEGKVSMQDSRLQELENSMMQVLKHIPLNIYSDVVKVEKKVNIIENLFKQSCRNIEDANDTEAKITVGKVDQKDDEFEISKQLSLNNIFDIGSKLLHEEVKNFNEDAILEVKSKTKSLEDKVTSLETQLEELDSQPLKMKELILETMKKIKQLDKKIKNIEMENDIKPLLVRLVQIENKLDSLDLKQSRNKSKDEKSGVKYCQYPLSAASGSITVTKDDYNCLESSKFLNDIIIDFYLKYLENENIGGILNRAHVFNTYFFNRLNSPFTLRKDNKLKSSGNNLDNTNLQINVYERVKNWTKKVDLFEKDFIVVPVNEKLHWYLCIICYPNSVGKLESSSSDYKKKPCILVFDSLRGNPRTEVCDKLRSYLSSEWSAKHCDEGDRVFTEKNMPQYNPKVRGQQNSKDCGVFLLQYVESFFTNGPDKDWGNDSIHHLSLFSRSEVNSKRSEIARIIRELTMKLNEEQTEFPSLNFVTELSPIKMNKSDKVIERNLAVKRRRDDCVFDTFANESSAKVVIDEDSMNVDNFTDDSKLLIDEDAEVAKDEIVTEETVQAVVLPSKELNFNTKDLNNLASWVKETNEKRFRKDLINC